MLSPPIGKTCNWSAIDVRVHLELSSRAPSLVEQLYNKAIGQLLQFVIAVLTPLSGLAVMNSYDNIPQAFGVLSYQYDTNNFKQLKNVYIAE